VIVTACASAAALGDPREVREGVVVHIEDGDTIGVRIAIVWSTSASSHRRSRGSAPRHGWDAPAGEGGGGSTGAGGRSAREPRAGCRGERDHYGRHARYVWVGDRMINSRWCAGQCAVLTIPPNASLRTMGSSKRETRIASHGRGSGGVATSAGPRTARHASRRVHIVHRVAAPPSPPAREPPDLRTSPSRAPPSPKRPGARQARARRRLGREHLALRLFGTGLVYDPESRRTGIVGPSPQPEGEGAPGPSRRFGRAPDEPLAAWRRWARDGDRS